MNATSRFRDALTNAPGIVSRFAFGQTNEKSHVKPNGMPNGWPNEKTNGWPSGRPNGQLNAKATIASGDEGCDMDLDEMA